MWPFFLSPDSLRRTDGKYTLHSPSGIGLKPAFYEKYSDETYSLNLLSTRQRRPPRLPEQPPASTPSRYVFQRRDTPDTSRSKCESGNGFYFVTEKYPEEVALDSPGFQQIKLFLNFAEPFYMFATAINKRN